MITALFALASLEATFPVALAILGAISDLLLVALITAALVECVARQVQEGWK